MDRVKANLERVLGHTEWLDQVLDDKRDKDRLIEIITLCLNDDSYIPAIYSTALVIATSHELLIRDMAIRLRLVRFLKELDNDGNNPES